MAREMTVEEFGRWAAGIMSVDKKSWKRELRQVRKLLRNSQKARLRAHVDPAGRPWAKRSAKPRPKVGDIATMVVDHGGKVIHRRSRQISARIVYRRIRNRRDKARAMAFRLLFGPPIKAVNALVRTRKAAGAPKTTAIRDYLTRGWRAFRMGKNWLTYGYKNGTRWIEQLHGGATRKGARLPARRIVGFTRGDISQMVEIFADGYLRRALK